MNYLNPALRSLILLLSLTLLFSSCKKTELSAAEWGELATAKRKEIQSLTLNIPCSQKSTVSIQEISNGCSNQFFAIQAADLAKYEKLKKEYLDFTDKQYAAWNREGLIVDPCFETIWALEQPIRLECQSDTVHLVTSENISLGEAATLAAETYTEIMADVEAQTCAGESSWMYTLLVKDKIMEVEYIPYLRSKDFSSLKKKVSLYNRLKLRIIESQGPIDYVRNELTVDKVECVNGKPVVKLYN